MDCVGKAKVSVTDNGSEITYTSDDGYVITGKNYKRQSETWVCGTKPGRNGMPDIDLKGFLFENTLYITETTTVTASYELESQEVLVEDQPGVPGAGKRLPSCEASGSPETHCTNAQLSSGPYNRAPTSPNLTKMLLLNGYPITYIILWLP
ncbi:uncharacterized protein FTOL_07271 [Fusarium torulosum]|uniref:Uncharacterized protein n=1 Tax=Fusarium torulosum TaxID=33205 RepID=A0AAE8SJ84_9HYPO|nr:uncharacterized protein FTOL_07271 [Fusarium torulosum]